MAYPFLQMPSYQRFLVVVREHGWATRDEGDRVIASRTIAGALIERVLPARVPMQMLTPGSLSRLCALLGMDVGDFGLHLGPIDRTDESPAASPAAVAVEVARRRSGA